MQDARYPMQDENMQLSPCILYLVFCIFYEMTGYYRAGGDWMESPQP
jgi:hypothetical protein